MNSEALLTGRLFDDRGNRMSPSHVRKGGRKYRYYLSCALFHGAAERAGSVRRVPAADIEALVIRSVREHLNNAQNWRCRWAGSPKFGARTKKLLRQGCAP